MHLQNDWMTQNWKQLQQAARNISQNHELWTDLLQHCLVDFLEKPESQSIIDNGYAKFYIVRMMMNQWRSVTSPFYRIYRSNDHKSIDELDLTEWYYESPDEPQWDIDRVKTILEYMSEDRTKAGWYHAKLVELYAETPNFSQLATVTKISRTSISKSVDRARKEIKQKYYS
jgi:DNA-directed RNA polymerase specialized sigma24 family protein